MDHDPQSTRDHAPWRALAWCQLDIHRMGALSRHTLGVVPALRIDLEPASGSGASVSDVRSRADWVGVLPQHRLSHGLVDIVAAVQPGAGRRTAGYRTLDARAGVRGLVEHGRTQRVRPPRCGAAQTPICFRARGGVRGVRGADGWNRIIPIPVLPVLSAPPRIKT